MLYLDETNDSSFYDTFAKRIQEFMSVISDKEALNKCGKILNAVNNGNYYYGLTICKKLLPFERSRLEYLSKLKYLERRKKKFKKLFCFSNTALQLGSVVLPTLITIKDNINIHDVPKLKKVMDVSAIILSVVMGIITNLTVFFKVNQRYSLYTQYDNKLKQEMRRFITYSEKYNDSDVKDTHRLFPQFSVAIENYIEELSNQEYDYIVGNKEKDMNAFAKKDEIYNRGNINREIVISDKPKRKRDPKDKLTNPQMQTPRNPKKERAPDEKSTDEEDKNSEEDKVFEDDKEIIDESKNKDGEKNN